MERETAAYIAAKIQEECEELAVEVLNEILYGESSHYDGKANRLGYRHSVLQLTAKSVREHLIGKCDSASLLFMKWFKDFAFENHLTYQIQTEHGELTHNRKIDPNYWALQHTMVRIDAYGETIWVDCTWYQFSNILYPDLKLHNHVNTVYVNNRKPWWFLPDENNFMYTRVGKWINNHIRMKVKMKIDGNVLDVKMGLLEVLAFKVHGDICTALRNMRKKQK